MKEEPKLDDAPFEVRRLLKRCLEKDPNKRLRDIGDARELIEEPLPHGRGSEGRGWEKARFGAGALIVAAVFAAAFAVLAFVHFRERAPEPELVRFEIPAPPGATFGGSLQLAPDGRKVVFIATAKGGVSMLWVRPLDSTEARPLAGTEGAGNGGAFWSPDSRAIAFFAEGKLKRIDAAGGPTQTVCEVATPAGGFWTADNRIVYGTLGLAYVVPAVGGTPAPLTKLDSARQEVAHEPFAMLPDGRHFLYLRLSLPLEKGGVYVGSLDAKARRRPSVK